MNLIIVDDEVLAVEGLMVNIEWKKWGIDEVFTAYNIQQVKEIFQRETIDILLCDIEMPMGNGIELLRWLRQNKYNTECVFLTCHEEFSYAREALQLGSHEYLLKPIEPDKLLEVILCVEEKIRGKMEVEKAFVHEKQWEKNKEKLKNSFWRDILFSSNPALLNSIMKKAEDSGIMVSDNSEYMLILFRIQKRSKYTMITDEHLVEFSLNNIADEIFSGEDKAFIKADKNLYVMIFIVPDIKEKISEINDKLKLFVKIVEKYLRFEMVFYKTSFKEISEAAFQLQKLLTEDKRYNEIHALKQKINEEQEVKDSESSTVELVIQYISDHISEDLSRENLAGYVYLNPDYLNRIFKREVGMPIKEYIQNEKMKIAKELLEMTDLTVSEIGKQVGYFNFGHFSTSFKKITGRTPGDYRIYAKSENEKW